MRRNDRIVARSAAAVVATGVFAVALGVATGSPVVAAAVGGLIIFVLVYVVSRQLQ